MKQTPVATYRLQFRNGMDFDRAADLVPYLARLGISHLYASPLFTAVSGSTHGYDVTQPDVLDPAIGGEAGFERLSAALREAQMGLILDIVPNHMAASLENPWWRSVIRQGPESLYADHFDIDWKWRLTLPVLAKDFASALADGDITLGMTGDGHLAFRLNEDRFPLRPESVTAVAEKLGGTPAALLQDLQEEDAGLEARLRETGKDPAFMQKLHALQFFELICWKDAARRLSYRRFFEVAGLAGVRVELRHVFDAMHRLVLRLVRDGKVDGLRVDHVDGLAMPGRYLHRLRQEAGPGIWILVEKILEEGEALPRDWEDCGTTGYEFIAALAHLLTDAAGFAEISRLHDDFTGKPSDRIAELRAARKQILTRNFAGELARLEELAMAPAKAAGIARQEVALALKELILAFEVYRTYGEEKNLSEADRKVLARAAARALERADADAVGFVAGMLSGGGGADARQFRIRFQQLTGPVMAKSVEDTFFFRATALAGLNEVGCPPLPHPGGVDAFHRRMQEGPATPGLSLLATTTHDTKWGEDSRARLLALAERPQFWSDCVRRWHAMNRKLRLNDALPERETEWLIYQALLAIWPPNADAQDPRMLGMLRERFLPWCEKALREAKLRTGWVDPNEPYEAAVLHFAGGLFEPEASAFRAEFSVSIQPFVHAGSINSLTQTLARLTAPGVPDLYQGAEGLTLQLVDPDNRRIPDFATLAGMLDLEAGPGEMHGHLLNGRFKQWMIARVLACRAHHAALFLHGDYLPLASAPHYPAFVREGEGKAAIVLLQRLPCGNPGPGNLRVPLPEHLRGRQFRNVLTDATFVAEKKMSLEMLLDGLPVMLGVAAAA